MNDSLMDFKTRAARDAAMSTGMTDGMEIELPAARRLALGLP